MNSKFTAKGHEITHRDWQLKSAMLSPYNEGDPDDGPSDEMYLLMVYKDKNKYHPISVSGFVKDGYIYDGDDFSTKLEDSHSLDIGMDDLFGFSANDLGYNVPTTKTLNEAQESNTSIYPGLPVKFVNIK